MNYLFILLFSVYPFLLLNCQIARTVALKNNQTICFTSQSQIHPYYDLNMCYRNYLQISKIVIWFTIEKDLYNMMDSYRFVLRPLVNFVSLNTRVRKLTDFTELTDFNNSIRIFNLDSGQYEVCVEFYMNATQLIYQPHDACVPLRAGRLFVEPPDTNPAPLFISLGSATAIFFIIGLIVQSFKQKRQRKSISYEKPRSRSSSIPQSVPFKQKRDRLMRLFRRYIDKPESSYMREWARDLASRHRPSTAHPIVVKRSISHREGNRNMINSIAKERIEEEQTDYRDRLSSEPTVYRDRLSSEPTLTSNHIYTISDKVHTHNLPKRSSFDCTMPKEQRNSVIWMQ